MELRQLRYFVEVGRLKSFSAASKTLFITQSTLSQQIRKLEEELGVDLLIRDTRHVTLSDYGEQFFPGAVQILQDAQAGIERIRDVGMLQVGTLSIGSTYSFNPLLRQTVLDFQRQYPHIRLQLVSTDKDRLQQMLLDRELDIALSYKSVFMDERIDSHSLFRNRLCLVAREGFLPKDIDRIPVSSLGKYPLALPSKGLQARDILESILFASGVKLDIRLEINSIHFLLDMVANSNVATVLSGEATHHLKGLAALPIDHPEGQMEGCYHYLKGAYVKKAAQAFIQLLTENNTFNRTFLSD